jgi:hypothetical protein
MEETGNYCATNDCYGVGYVEYCGFCPLCWRQFKPSTRKALVEERVQPPPIIEQHVHQQHYHPPQSRLVTLLVGITGGMFGVGILYLVRHWTGWAG